MNFDGEEPLLGRQQFLNDLNLRGSRRLLVILALGSAAGFTFAGLFLWGMDFVPGEITIENEYYKDENTADDHLANILFEQVRIACIIIMKPEDQKANAEIVERTWGKRCNQLVIVGNPSHKFNVTLKLPVNEEYNNLWNNTLVGLRYLVAVRRHEFEWVLKTDLQSFAIMENLRYMLSNHSFSDSIYYGVRFGSTRNAPRSSSYILSLQALYDFHEETLNYETKCRTKIKPTEDENVEFERCMKISRVEALDPRDAHGRHRFLSYLAKEPPIYYGEKVKLDPKNYQQNYLNYSDYPVCFHFVPFEEMYHLEYMIYQLRPFGLLDQKASDNQTLATASPFSTAERNIL